MLFWTKKEHPVAKMMQEYLDYADECLTAFEKAFLDYLDNGRERLADDADNVDRLESDCDRVRRAIEREMFAKSLIPESRADIMRLVEMLDKIPNRAERIIYNILVKRIDIPDMLKSKFRDMIHVNIDCWKMLSNGVRELFSNPEKVNEALHEVDIQETSSDVLRREILRLVYDRIEGAEQHILLDDLATLLSKLSDACEDAAEYMAVIVIKRLV